VTDEQPPPPEYFAAAGAVIGADHIEKLNSGAALTFALYQCPKAWWKAEALPLDVVRAYIRACQAFGINRHPPLNDLGEK
jgi:hypothetical protein